MAIISGEEGFRAANEMNVPVDVWIMHRQDGKWRMNYSFYMPRKGHVWMSDEPVIADTREDIQKLLKEVAIPIFENALKQVNGMVDGTNRHLYYWDGTLTLEGEEDV